jgi:hypothetical protein
VLQIKPYYFPRMHNLILQPQLQAVSDLVNKVIVAMTHRRFRSFS